MNETNLFDLLDDLNPDEDDDELLEGVLQHPDFLPRLKGLLRAELNRRRRAEAAAAERRAFQAVSAGQIGGLRLELKGHRFALPDGRFVDWMTASADDHLARAEWQMNRATTITRDAKRHELAARLIQQAEVECLGQIRSIETLPRSLRSAAKALL